MHQMINLLNEGGLLRDCLPLLLLMIGVFNSHFHSYIWCVYGSISVFMKSSLDLSASNALFMTSTGLSTPVVSTLKKNLSFLWSILMSLGLLNSSVHLYTHSSQYMHFMWSFTSIFAVWGFNEKTLVGQTSTMAYFCASDRSCSSVSRMISGST